MRIAVVDTYYPSFVADHYRRRPELRRASYAEQLRALLDRCFGTSDAYSSHLSELGHEAVDLAGNCLEVQTAWALEHGRGPVSRLMGSLPTRLGAAARLRFLREIATAQIDQFDPDVVYVQDLSFFQQEQVDALRREGRFVVGQLGSAPPGLEVLKSFQLIATSFPHFVPRLLEAGIDAEYFRIGFYERVRERLRITTDPDSPRDISVAFVGTIHPGSIHAGGTAFFERLCEAVPLEIWGFVNDDLRRGSPIHERYHGEAWGLEMYEVLARSRITINRHGDIANGYSNNMRLYEATGVGTLLLTEASANLEELFEPGREVVAYYSEDDLVEKIEHYLEQDSERAAIAAAGQQRTLSEHTYRQRMAELAALLELRLGVR